MLDRDGGLTELIYHIIWWEVLIVPDCIFFPQWIFN